MTITSTHCPVDLGSRARGECADRAAVGRGSVVGPPIPFITPRSGEELVPISSFTLRPGGAGVGYRREQPGDRDRFGVLWWRTAPSDTRGRPQFRQVDPFRQRDVMFGMLCQVCGGPPSRTPRGILFFHQQGPDADPRWWPNGERTLQPPVCLPCARAAMEYCPFVGGAVAVRAKKPRLWGVFGTAFVPDPAGGLRPLPQDAECRYGNVKHRRWVVAEQAIIELDRATVVDLRDEFAAAGLEFPEHRAS